MLVRVKRQPNQQYANEAPYLINKSATGLARGLRSAKFSTSHRMRSFEEISRLFGDMERAAGASVWKRGEIRLAKETLLQVLT